MASALVLVTSSTRKRPRGPSGQQSRRVSRRRAPSARSSRVRRLAHTPHTQEAPPDSPAGRRAALTFRLCVCSGKGKEKRQARKCGRCSHLAPATSCPRPRAQGRLPLLPESRGRRSRRLSSSPLGETALRPSHAEQRVQVRSGKQLGISGDQHSGNDGPCPL